MNIKILDTIIVFDEAHNLENFTEQIYSLELSLESFKKASCNNNIKD